MMKFAKGKLGKVALALGSAGVLSIGGLLLAGSAFAATGTTTATSTQTTNVGITPGPMTLAQGVYSETNGTVATASSSQSASLSVNLANEPYNALIPFNNTVGSGNTPAIIAQDQTGEGLAWTLQQSATQLTETAPGAGFASGTTALTLPFDSLIGGQPALQTTAGTATQAQAIMTGTTITAGTVPTNANGTNGYYLDASGGAPVTVASIASGTGDGEWGFYWGNTTGVAGSSGLAVAPQFTFVLPSTGMTDPTNYPSAATPFSTTVTTTIVQS